MSTKKLFPRQAAAENIFEQIQEVMFLFRAKLIEVSKVDGDGIGGMELRVLQFFDRRPGATQVELVHHSRRDKGQIARLVRILMERSLLEREIPGKRNSGLLLTEQGRALQGRLQRYRATLANRYAGALSAPELTHLTGLLQIIKEALAAPA